MTKPKPVTTSDASRNFCNYITHEVANPLNGMLMGVELIERYFQANPKALDEMGELPRILKREVMRLILLLKELRSSGVLNGVDLQPTSPATEIRELLALQSAYYHKRSIRVYQHVPADLPPIMADRNKLRQALLNLCKNALEAMPNGGTLTLRGYVSDEWLCLDIADTGDGIPEALEIFEPGVTDKPRSSGLGLAIAREIVKQHSGTLSYTTQAGIGTMFHLTFPLQARPSFTNGHSIVRPKERNIDLDEARCGRNIRGHDSSSRP